MKYILLIFAGCALISGCQKILLDNNRPTGINSDSTINAGDTLTYEVLTKDTTGWFGLWNEADGKMGGNVLDSVTFGTPVCFPSGWRHTIISPDSFFQPLVSVASRTYQQEVSINLYRNGKLIQVGVQHPLVGVAKLMVKGTSPLPKGTATDPIVTYEVVLSKSDTTIFEFDSWTGHWMEADGVYNDFYNRVLSFMLPIPSGWRRSFKPPHLPFTMSFTGGPYLKNGNLTTVNFYVNGQLVKTTSSRDWIYAMDYTVQ